MFVPVPGARVVGGLIIGGAAIYGGWQAWQYWNEDTEDDSVVYPDNPDSAPEKFRPKRGGGKVCEDGSVWDKDRTSHGGEQWKRWPSVRDYEKGNKPTSVWPDGRVRK